MLCHRITGLGLGAQTIKSGIGTTDELTPKIWNGTHQLLIQYGLGLDIVYSDPHYPVEGNYSKVYWWNQTVSGT
jgi:hypothetical protein